MLHFPKWNIIIQVNCPLSTLSMQTPMYSHQVHIFVKETWTYFEPFYHIQLVRYNIYLCTPVLLRKRDWLKLAKGKTSTSWMQQHILSIVLCFAVCFMYACKCVCIVLCFFSQMEERSRAKHQGAREAAGFVCLLVWAHHPWVGFLN